MEPFILLELNSGKQGSQQNASQRCYCSGFLGKNKGNGSFLINSATNTKHDLKVEVKRYFNEFLAGTTDD